MSFPISLIEYLQLNCKEPFEHFEQFEKIFEHEHSHLSCGKIVGNFLGILTSISQAKNILEIGTMIGFSTICMATKLPPEGLIHTIEIRDNDAKKAAENFNFFNVSNKIKQHIGNALEIIPTLNQTFDFVFLDADKINYLNYYELVLPKLKNGGIIVADNALFHNYVLDETTGNKNGQAMRLFNEHISKDKRVNNVVLNVRDGLNLILKK